MQQGQEGDTEGPSPALHLIGKTKPSGNKKEGKLVEFRDSFMYALSQETYEDETRPVFLHVEVGAESYGGRVM